MNIGEPVTNLSKIHPSTQKHLKALGILTVKNLLEYYPRRYLDFSKFNFIKDVRPGETVTLKVTVKSISSRLVWKTRRMLAEAVVGDETGQLKVTWFNQGYMAKTLKAGDEVFLSGKVEQYRGLQLINPIQEKISDHNLHTGRLVPIYKLPETFYSRTFRTLVNSALPLAEEITDIVPENIRAKYHIPNKADAIKELHFPTSKEAITKAQERLAFEEMLIQQLALKLHKIELQKHAAPNTAPDIANIKNILSRLPFTLTQAQKKSLWEICKDLEGKHPMNRLLMGDVGSGKTIVALLAALQIIKEGFQVVLLAPTEILAKQHMGSVQTAISNFKFQISNTGLLTRNFHLVNNDNVTKPQLIKQIANGEVEFIIGTHALLQEKVKFKNLALVIIDEQHRLGVAQRSLLLKQADNIDGQTNWTPHLLSMTATPIPRTAALTIYGDLDISTIDELPKSRLPIKTWVVPEAKRLGAYEFIKKEITSGRQAFIITPLVEESEKLQVKSVKAEFEHLQKTVFKNFKLGLVYGSMKGADKDQTMTDFKNKAIDILVATSVIEIGIDIPNASVMIIEGAERFGLAQLHQLRGRVGRGEYQSYCLLFTSDKDKSALSSREGFATPARHCQSLAGGKQSSDSFSGLPRRSQSGAPRNDKNERLEFFAKTDSGFALAEFDMQTRGFGSLFGTDQTGFDFKYGQYLTFKVLEKAKFAALDLITENPSLSNYPELLRLSQPLSEELHLE